MGIDLCNMHEENPQKTKIAVIMEKQPFFRQNDHHNFLHINYYTIACCKFIYPLHLCFKAFEVC